MQPPTAISRPCTRREALGLGAMGVAALYWAGCGGSSSSQSVTGTVDVTWGYSYLGYPGSMGKYWSTLKSNLAKAKLGYDLGSLTGVPDPDLFQRLQAYHTAKRGPTIEPYFPDWFTYEFVAQGVLSPLDDLVGGQGEIDNWLFASPPIDGKHYGMPFVVEQAPIFANVDLLRKANVSLPDRFESISAMYDAFDRLKRAGITPVIMGATDGLNTDKWIQVFELQNMNSRTQLGDLVLGKPVDDQVVYSWIDGLATLRDKYVNSDAGKINEQDGVSKFINGEGAFAMLNPAPVFAEKSNKFQIVEYPKGPGQLAIPVAVSADAYFITNYGKNQGAAGKVFEYINRPETLALFHHITGEFPCNKQFDASALTGLPRTAWDIIAHADPQPFWPHNFVPEEYFDIQYDIAPKLIAGASPTSIRQEFDKRISDFRSRSAAEIQVFTKYMDTLRSEGF
jgi:ABC-type glycerol-3-phosphate transport system substrate-binding protein